MARDQGRYIFRAFRYRNYRLFFCGQSISQIGTWMQRTGVSWVVYAQSHSTVMLGLSVFASQFPSFLFSILGGIVSDRYNRYKLLLFTQTASMVQAIMMAWLTYNSSYEIWQILALSAALGVINAFDMPARQPLVHELVGDKADLPNALALNSSMVNLARLLGPAISGIILGKFGASVCFLLNAISFIAVLVSLLMMELPVYVKRVIKSKMHVQFWEGFEYLKQTPTIAGVLLLLTLVSLLVLPYDTLLPAFARVVFKGDATTFGYISSIIGLGSILGSLFLASLKPTLGLKFVLLGSVGLLATSLMLFSQISYFPVAMFFALLTGFGAMTHNTVCITIIQLRAAPDMRGRAMSYVAMAYFGMLPLGSLAIGTLSQKIGPQTTILCQGVIALFIAATFAFFLRKDFLNKRNVDQSKEAKTIVSNNS